MSLGKSGFATKCRPKAPKSALPSRTAASAVSGSKPPRRNNRSRENLSQPHGRNVPLALGDQHVTFDAWFDDVQASESKAVQLLRDVVKQRDRVPHSKFRWARCAPRHGC